MYITLMKHKHALDIISLMNNLIMKQSRNHIITARPDPKGWALHAAPWAWPRYNVAHPPQPTWPWHVPTAADAMASSVSRDRRPHPCDCTESGQSCTQGVQGFLAQTEKLVTRSTNSCDRSQLSRITVVGSWFSWGPRVIVQFLFKARAVDQ